jgi:hypothetical protein
MTLQYRTITTPAVIVLPEIDNLLPMLDDDDDDEESNNTCTEELIMEERIRIAQETCRQRRMCTYFVLTIYLIIAIVLYFRRSYY